jgi:hypothetical protein
VSLRLLCTITPFVLRLDSLSKDRRMYVSDQGGVVGCVRMYFPGSRATVLDADPNLRGPDVWCSCCGRFCGSVARGELPPNGYLCHECRTPLPGEMGES